MKEFSGFEHLVIAFESSFFECSEDSGVRKLQGIYRQLYSELIFEKPLNDSRTSPVLKSSELERSYNVLLTRQWMLLVPRQMESVESIAINALGFAGGILTRTDAERDFVLRIGPMHVLQGVSFHMSEEQLRLHRSY